MVDSYTVKDEGDKMIIPDDLIEVCGNIFAGEYDINYTKPDPVILDIGANVGAFTRWAKYKWPAATIHAYEPLPDCTEYLEKNVEDLENVFVHKVAVGSKAETRHLYYGGNSRAMNSFEKSDYTRDYGVPVQVIDAKTLPTADVVKCDTEGSEVEILGNLQFDPHVIMAEYHSLKDRRTIEEMFADKYTLLEFKLSNLRTGNLKFIRSDIIKVV